MVGNDDEHALAFERKSGLVLIEHPLNLIDRQFGIGCSFVDNHDADSRSSPSAQRPEIEISDLSCGISRLDFDQVRQAIAFLPSGPLGEFLAVGSLGLVRFDQPLDSQVDQLGRHFHFLRSLAADEIGEM
jgi:hypothetical protein